MKREEKSGVRISILSIKTEKTEETNKYLFNLLNPINLNR